MQQVRSLGLAWCLSTIVGLSGAAASGCADGGGGGGGGRRDSGTTDGEAPRDSGGGDGGATCSRDEDCPDDGVFCNGRLVCNAMGRCVAGVIPTCDDGITCTRDTCVGASDECQNTPDDTMCPEGNVCYPTRGCSTAPPCEFDSDCTDDGVFCNGPETCVGGVCLSAGMRDCGPLDSCALSECVESMGMCVETTFDHLTDPAHCGPTGMNDCVACPGPATGAMHVAASCTAGVCGLACEMGWFDTDAMLENGCECNSPPDSPDAPDDAFEDTNCDGIDGDAARAIFVATSGRDTNPGTRASPKRTLAAGIDAARTMGFDVYVSVGDYSVASTVELADGVSIYGGYNAAMAWARSDEYIVRIVGPATAVRAQSISTETIVDRVNVTAASSTAVGGASIGVHAIDAPGLVWRVSTVEAGSGGPGADGSGGSRGADGGPGSDSVGGVEYGGPISCSSNPRPGRQPGGTSACGRTGGYGGVGGSSGGGGEAGQTVGSASGGGGASGARGDGTGGNMGSGGSAGANGSAGSGTGAIVGGAWVPGNGGDGGNGGNGGGGSGGGGGGGDTTTVIPPALCETCGDTGGGGGAGGCGGTLGRGGRGGGASLGFLLVRSSMTLELVEIRTGVGGDGGMGGDGGGGGTGGAGGRGSRDAAWTGTRDDDNQGYGGGGGRGGDGGRGGHGGGGGGGPSIGILRDSASSIATSLLSFDLGTAGLGGDSSGNNGQRGVRMNEVAL